VPTLVLRTAAIVVLAAAGTTTAVPSLRALVAAHGAGAGAGALFVAAHVLGQVAGAAWVGRRLRGSGELAARRLVVTALVASTALNAMMAAVAVASGWLGLLVGLRLVDGVAHVAAVMGVLGAIGGDGAVRDRRLRLLGGLLVIGIATGLGAGTLLIGGGVAAPIVGGAVLTALALALAGSGIPARVERARGDGPARAPIATVLAVTGMRFAFGVLTVGVPFIAVTAAEMRFAGATLGTMMLASVAALPVVAAAARRAGWGVIGQGGAVTLAGCLAAIALPGLIGSPAGLPWAVAGGVGAAAIYAAALAAIAAIDDVGARTRAVGVIHAAGSAGHGAGALAAGAAMSEHGLAVAPATATALLGAVAVGLAGVILLFVGRQR
jgi:hypothetical protein